MAFCAEIHAAWGTGSTVRSYLSWLRDTGRLTVRFENGLLLWQTMD